MKRLMLVLGLAGLLTGCASYDDSGVDYRDAGTVGGTGSGRMGVPDWPVVDEEAIRDDNLHRGGNMDKVFPR